MKANNPMAKVKKYNDPRPYIPAALRREIRIEAREACIIYQQAPGEYAHIDGDRNNNVASNLAYLCPNHHASYDRGDIERKDILVFKAKAQAENEVIIKLKQQLDYVLGAKEIDVSGDFGQLKLKYQSMLSDYGDKLIFYQCFIYLIPEFYLDDRAKENRSVIRDLLSVSIEEEQAIIQHLLRLNIVAMTGDLIYLVDEDDAKTALSELLTAQKISIDDLISKFIRT